MQTQTQTHTPSPWEVSTYENGDVAVYGENDPSGRDLALVRGSSEAEANARLIAAAPDLLAALEAALPLIIHAWRKSADARDTQAEERYSETGKAMQAAISKATNA